MKVTLDIDALREAGEISSAEYERLLTLGRKNTHTVAFNLLIGFGVVAVALGIAALVQNATAVTMIGLVVLLAGFLPGANTKSGGFCPTYC